MRLKTSLGIAIGTALGTLLAAKALRSRRAVDFKGRTVVIFGGSRGLGLAMAREFSTAGAHVVLAARDEEELERAAADIERQGGTATTISCDITDRGQITRTVDRIVHDRGGIDVLVNNAGIIQVGPLEHMTIDDFEEAMATHFWGPLYAILAALPYMRGEGSRRIVNISSIGGKIAVPHLLPYSASKFALTGLSEGLRAELSSQGFAVTTVCPGLMRTGSTYNAMFKGQHRREFAWFHLSNAIPGVSVSAARAARRIVDACRHGDPEAVVDDGTEPLRDDGPGGRPRDAADEIDDLLTHLTLPPFGICPRGDRRDRGHALVEPRETDGVEIGDQPGLRGRGLRGGLLLGASGRGRAARRLGRQRRGGRREHERAEDDARGRDGHG